LVLAAVGALLLTSSRVSGCPCSDDGGTSSLVRDNERYAAALVATSRHALGHFDAFGQYHALGPADGEASEELLLRVGLRLPRRVEWLGELGYASYRFHTPSRVEAHTGVGDTLLRARWTLRDEGMPHEGPWLPSLALAGLLRAPLGALADNRSAGFGSGGAQLGLGAWELGVGFDAARSLVPELQLMLGAEGAYRLEDHVLGRARRLGPRLDATVGARLMPSAWLAGTFALRARFTADVALGNGDGNGLQRLPGTAERLWSLVLGAAVYARNSNLRSSLTLSWDPPVGSFSVGTTAAAALSVALAYGVPAPNDAAAPNAR
jgi:hypothetical protein